MWKISGAICVAHVDTIFSHHGKRMWKCFLVIVVVVVESSIWIVVKGISEPRSLLVVLV